MVDGDDPRVRMAAERTLLAWIRTGLAVMAFGFVVARHEAPKVDAAVIGFALIVLGAGAAGLSAREYTKIFRSLAPGTPPEANLQHWSIGLASVLAVLGLALAAWLLIHAIGEGSQPAPTIPGPPRTVARPLT